VLQYPPFCRGSRLSRCRVCQAHQRSAAPVVSWPRFVSHVLAHQRTINGTSQPVANS
jgi:hypothetical protein